MSLTIIEKEVLVKASQETAFKVFTEKMDSWWPKTHHVGKTPMLESILEPKKNGRWYGRHEDGSESNVGYVLEWEPYGRLVLAWQVDGNFHYDPDLITEVEVQFIPEGRGSTRVKLGHKDLQKLMGGSKVIADMDGGWGMIMNLYKNVTDAA
ncbi:MAG TPA: SRPBCC family protein [Puia sp.]|nr:SRPBCC family protein [Puia sp.]